MHHNAYYSNNIRKRMKICTSPSVKNIFQFREFQVYIFNMRRSNVSATGEHMRVNEIFCH